ncbi:nitronate monooxygenase [Candidatus Parcubacteria bacterium]|nr:nitronate monooxygenase [Candidatus Parcubacteria bacterium]
MLNKEQIKEIIPYDDPFLWVDEVESIKGNTIIGYKGTSPDDSYFKGHFTDFPIMPGVLVVEGVAQIGTILLRKKIGEGHQNKHLLAYQVRSAFFFSPIYPGDRIKYKVDLLGYYNDKVANFKGEVFVGETKKCEVRFVVAVVDKKELQEKKIGKIPQTKLPSLKIGSFEAALPIIQGGMAIRVSLHNLAGNVAKQGGVGIIAISGMIDPEEVREEIKKARAISPKGIIGINIMGVVGHFTKLVTAAMESGIDLVIQGAGFRADIFELGKKYNVPVVSIASSVKVAKKAETMGAAAIVIEGSDAGGHLGFPPGHDFRKTIDILKDVVKEVKVPLIAAGGIFTGEDIVTMLRAGAKGVQMATRFVTTEECDANQKFKDAYLKATKDDVIMIKSPVGLPGRALKTPFTEKLLAGKAPKPNPLECKGCIGDVCNKSYCILKALENARKGDLDNGLVFAGSNVWRIDKILSVEELIKELTAEANQILKKEPLLI